MQQPKKTAKNAWLAFKEMPKVKKALLEADEARKKAESEVAALQRQIEQMKTDHARKKHERLAATVWLIKMSALLLSPALPNTKDSKQFPVRPADLLKSDWRRTWSYRAWRARVIRRDGRCQCCGSIKHRHAHHIEHATYAPALRFSVSNGIALCSKCHSLFHNDYVGNTRKKCDRHQLSEFFKIKAHFSSLALHSK